MEHNFYKKSPAIVLEDLKCKIGYLDNLIDEYLSSYPEHERFKIEIMDIDKLLTEYVELMETK